jgi:hypothetical protein
MPRSLWSRLDRLKPAATIEYTEAESAAMRAKLNARLDYVLEHEPQSAEHVFAAFETHVPDWRERIARLGADRPGGRRP